MFETRIEKIWIGAGLVAALLLAVIAYFFLISPQNAQASDLHAQTSDAQVSNAVLQSKINSLRADQSNLATYKATLAADRAALPATDDMSDFLRTLQSVGQSSLVQVTSITVGTATAPGATGSAQTAGGVVALPITLQVTGTDARLLDFLTQLQRVQPRAVVLSQVNQQASTTSAAQTLQISLQAFLAPKAG